MSYHQFRIANVLIVVISSALICSVRSLDDPELYYPDAWVSYGGGPEGHGENLYVDDTLIWRDLKGSGLITGHPDARVCVNGIFVVYRDAGFETIVSKDVFVLSGLNKCVDSFIVGSMQSGQDFGPIFTNSLALFSRKYLGGIAFTTDESTEEVNDRFPRTLESLLIVGKHPWTVVTTSGKAHCVTPAPDKKYKFPICAVTSFQNNDIQMTIQSVYKGCVEEGVAVLEIPDCTEFGGEFIEEFSETTDDSVVVVPEYEHTDDEEVPEYENTTDTDSSVSSVGSSVGSSSGFNFECGKDKEFLTLLDMRLNDDLFNLYQMRFPEKKKDFWETSEMIVELFDIAEFVCTGNNPRYFTTYYLRFIRETFIYLLEQKGNWGDESKLPKVRGHELNRRLLHNCWDATLNSLHVLPFRFNPINYNASRTNLSRTEKQLSNSGTVDLAVEIMWLVSNLALSTCHYRLEGQVDLWTDLYPTLNELFLESLREQWETPGSFLEYYKILLSGFDYEGAYHLVRACTAKVISYTKMDVFQRPFVEGGSASGKKDYQLFSVKTDDSDENSNVNDEADSDENSMDDK